MHRSRLLNRKNKNKMYYVTNWLLAFNSGSSSSKHYVLTWTEKILIRRGIDTRHLRHGSMAAAYSNHSTRKAQVSLCILKNRNNETTSLSFLKNPTFNNKHLSFCHFDYQSCKSMAICCLSNHFQVEKLAQFQKFRQKITTTNQP